MKKWRRTRASRTFIVFSVAIGIAATALSVYLISRPRRENATLRQATWHSISSARIDFGAMVTNRSYSVGSVGDPVSARLVLNEIYFHDNDFIFPFSGRVSCPRGVGDCSLEIRASVRFENGRIYAGELKLGTFAPHGIELGQDKKYVAAMLFEMVKSKLDILPFEVDRDFKAIHSINNDFIEFEK